ncbi:GNAT family N-acetyltransferase [Cecembia rubra]|uniref:GNAT family N-acetyltransferase n=1 Tax=Cecembia rubra TaxID=1485585 RepID=UPI0027150CA1|nr:GNAT family N-acetyltransferase [Cecembia rubra]
MKIEQFNRESKGFFKAIEEDKEAGRMTYSWAGENRFIIDHTEVNPEFKGKNVGKQLVMAAVNFARENNLKIIPLCPYAKSVFDKTAEIRDLL